MISIYHPTSILEGEVQLPSSKSISNRMLILRSLYDRDLNIHHLSEANDTQLLERILGQDSARVNVQDAGTAMRFLLAYYVAKGMEVEISGTHRMHERPIGDLVDALIGLGANLEYLAEEGYPPLRIGKGKLQNGLVDLTDVKSSQFVSALLMILPMYPGIKIKVNSSMNSWMFVDLTVQLMKELGFEISLNDGVLSCEGGELLQKDFVVDADWTSFYYWYSAACLSKRANLFFPGLSLDSVQAESDCYRWLDIKGLELRQEQDGVRLLQMSKPHLNPTKLNLNQFPDLAPTFAILFAAAKVRAGFEGLQSLIYKESDRDHAIKEHLASIGVSWERKADTWQLDPKDLKYRSGQEFKVYKDHRMAMSLLPLAMKEEIKIHDPQVVNKSYPGFWKDCEHLGFKITTVK